MNVIFDQHEQSQTPEFQPFLFWYRGNLKVLPQCQPLPQEIAGLIGTIIYWVVVSNIFYFHPYLGKIPILTNIFQMGWNHQLV